MIRTIMTGIRQLGQALYVHDKVLAAKFEAGVWLAGMYLQGEANKLVPIDTGVLRASSFVRAMGGGRGFMTIIHVGYTTDYAIYVHEDLTKNHGQAYNIKYQHLINAGLDHPRRPQEQAKFLEQPAMQDHDVIIEIVRLRMAQ